MMAALPRFVLAETERRLARLRTLHEAGKMPADEALGLAAIWDAIAAHFNPRRPRSAEAAAIARGTMLAEADRAAHALYARARTDWQDADLQQRAGNLWHMATCLRIDFQHFEDIETHARNRISTLRHAA